MAVSFVACALTLRLSYLRFWFQRFRTTITPI